MESTLSLRLRKRLGLAVALAPLWLLALLLAGPATAADAGTVVVGDGAHPSSCNQASLATAMNSNTDARIIFDCGGPAIITITQPGGLIVLGNQRFTIDGGDAITVSGLHSYRLFWIQPGGALTLTHILLTQGYAGGGGNYPNQGGAVLNEGGWLTVDHATLRDNDAFLAAGAIEDSGGTTHVNDSVIEDNEAPYGGGIDSLGSLTISNSVVSANHAITGGGLDVGGTLLIVNSQIVGNSAVNIGGGVRSIASASVVVRDSVLSGNHQTALAASGTAGGGAIAMDGLLLLQDTLLAGNSAVRNGGGLLIGSTALATIMNATFDQNQSAAFGGAIFDQGSGSLLSSLGMFSSTLSRNQANAGGGIYIEDSTFASIRLSTISGNFATTSGGGLYGGPGALELINVTVSGNTANEGGGVFVSGSASLLNVTASGNRANSIGGALGMDVGAAVVLTNTILAYSPHGGNCGGAPAASKFSISSDFTCTLSGLVKGNNPNGLDPRLTALGNYGGPTKTHMLQLNSPALDGVEGTDAASDDQRGQPRPAMLGYDIGAVERQEDDTSLAPRVFLSIVLR